MRCAFVVRLGSGSQPSEGRLVGSVEEVDSGKELFLGLAMHMVKPKESDG